MKKNPHLYRSLLGDPDAIAVREFRELDLGGSVLIVAPHPDDESLGCGGLVALLRATGNEVYVVIASGGEASHPDSKMFPPRELAKLRRREALEALKILGVNEEAVAFLKLPDGRIPHEWQEEFGDAVERVREVVSRTKATSIFTPWRRDVHHDHIAMTALVTEALKREKSSARVIEYPIWVWEAESHDKAPTSGEMIAWKLDVSEVLEKKKEAISMHTSQMTRLIADDPGGFVMSAEQQERFTGRYEIFLEARRAAEDRTLGSGYFEGMYVEDEDPWEFASSAYEAAKYEATLEALPRDRYGKVLELGCSIGVFTEMLAGRVESLVGIDASESAVARAVKRCGHLENVELRVGFVPEDWPEGEFDLIIVSEVAYYLSSEDLGRLFGLVVGSLMTGGEVLMVHWTPFVATYPQTGDQVHEFALAVEGLTHLDGRRAETYRIDTFRNGRE